MSEGGWAGSVKNLPTGLRFTSLLLAQGLTGSFRSLRDKLIELCYLLSIAALGTRSTRAGVDLSAVPFALQSARLQTS